MLLIVLYIEADAVSSELYVGYGGAVIEEECDDKKL